MIPWANTDVTISNLLRLHMLQDFKRVTVIPHDNGRQLVLSLALTSSRLSVLIKRVLWSRMMGLSLHILKLSLHQSPVH